MLPVFSYRGIDLVTQTSGDLHDEFDTETATIELQGSFFQAGNQYNAAGQSWDSGADPQEVTGVTFTLDSGSQGPVGLVRAVIYAHSGTFGTSSVPTGDPLVTSPWYATDGLTGTGVSYFFPMSGWTPTANTKYVVVIEHDIPFGEAVNYSCNTSIASGASADHGGNLSNQDDASAWSAQSSQDLLFKVYYETVVEPGSDDFIERVRDGTYSRRYAGWATA